MMADEILKNAIRVNDARGPGPRNLADRRHHLHVRIVARRGVRLNSGVDILDGGVAHAQDGHRYRQSPCRFFVHADTVPLWNPTCYSATAVRAFRDLLCYNGF